MVPTTSDPSAWTPGDMFCICPNCGCHHDCNGGNDSSTSWTICYHEDDSDAEQGSVLKAKKPKAREWFVPDYGYPPTTSPTRKTAETKHRRFSLRGSRI